MSKNELKAFIGLHRTVNKLDKEVSKIHTKFGLTLGQFAVLEALYHKGDLCVGQVQEKILSSTGTIPVIVKNLVKRDLLRQIKDENDKRKVILSLTDKGREIMDRAYPENEEVIIDFMKILNEDELESLVRILNKLN